jgi:uncharacterized protein (TIGR02145 family)
MKKFLFTSLLLAVIVLPPLGAQETGTFTDTRDGHVYKWVQLGNQTWMAENLAYLPQVNPVSDARFEGSVFYVYGYNGRNIAEARQESSFKRYGAFYNYDAARESCPDGWHLPSDQEWKELERFLGMGDEADRRGWRESGEAGKKLKSASGWNIDNGTDDVGFNALPAGCRGYGGFESQGFCAYFWTASPSGDDNGWRRGVCMEENGTCRAEDRRYFGISVRCVKD